MKFTPTHRPYWFVDIKWIVGILFFVALSACVTAYTAARLTDRNDGPRVVAFVIGTVAIQDTGDKDIKQQIQQQLDRGKTSFQPVEGFPAVAISKADLDLSTTDLKQKLFDAIGKTIYEDGLDGAAQKLFKNPKERDQFVEQASFLKIIGKDTHDNFVRLQTMLTVVVIVLLALLVYFSAGWGRLVSPGIIFVLVGLPGTVLAGTALSGKGGDTSLSTLLAGRLSAALNSGYGVLFKIGIALLVVALLGKIVTLILHRRTRQRLPSEKTPDELPSVPEKKSTKES